jgi:hypothetical protein
MDRLRQALKLEYFDPEDILAQPAGFEMATEYWITYSKRAWSAHERAQLKEEITHAAVFCEGIAPIWGRKVKFSPYAYGSHDCILMAKESAFEAFNRIRTLQLKALTGKGGTLQSIVDSLEKYHDPTELYVAITIDRPGEYDFSTVNISDDLRARLREVWLFGRFAHDRERWVFRGDVLATPNDYQIRIPGPPPALKKRESSPGGSAV